MGQKVQTFWTFLLLFRLTIIFSSAYLAWIFDGYQKIFKKKRLYRLKQATVSKQLLYMWKYTHSEKQKCLYCWQKLQSRQQLKVNCMIVISKAKTLILLLMRFSVTSLATNHLFSAAVVVFEKFLQWSILRKLWTILSTAPLSLFNVNGSMCQKSKSKVKRYL